jgi:hypothetical protein
MIIHHYMTQSLGKLPKDPAQSQNASCFSAHTIGQSADNRVTPIIFSYFYGGKRK